MKLTLDPCYDRVLVRRVDPPQAGTIIIPDNAKTLLGYGEVVAVGEGPWTAENGFSGMLVSPGDRVLFNRFAGTEVKLNGEDLIILDERDILGIFADAVEPDASKDVS